MPLPASQLTTTVFCGTRSTVQPFGMCLPSPPFAFGRCTSSVFSSCSLVGVGPALTTFCGLKRYHCAGLPLSASERVCGAESRSNRLPIATGTFVSPLLTEGPVRSASKS